MMLHDISHFFYKFEKLQKKKLHLLKINFDKYLFGLFLQTYILNLQKKIKKKNTNQ